MKPLKTCMLILVTAGLLLTAAGCDTVNHGAEDLTGEELEFAGQIIGESLSNESEGILSSLYESVSDISEAGIRYGHTRTGMKVNDGDHHHDGRGSESGYSAGYNPETGEHTVGFRRKFSRGDSVKTISVKSVYIFTDPAGSFLQFPQHHTDLIETIDFKGIRTGTGSGPHGSSEFSRTDTLYLTGVSSASPVMTLDGSHFGEGEKTMRGRDGNLTGRGYKVRFEIQDVQVDKDVVRENGSLEEGVTGFIGYRMTMTHTVDGETRKRNLSGTIELNGDGTALLRYDKAKQFFLIALRNGKLHL